MISYPAKTSLPSPRPRRSAVQLSERGSPLRKAHTSSPVTRRSSALLTVEQVAERCSVSTRTTRRWIKAGELRAHRLGHLVRVSEDDLATFLAAHRDP